jgi:hypothetical protein
MPMRVVEECLERSLENWFRNAFLVAKENNKKWFVDSFPVAKVKKTRMVRECLPCGEKKTIKKVLDGSGRGDEVNRARFGI